jgi:hypothetical protein
MPGRAPALTHFSVGNRDLNGEQGCIHNFDAARRMLAVSTATGLYIVL